MTASQHWDGHQKAKSKREAKDNLEKDSGKGKKQGRVGKLGGSQSSGTEQAVLDRKRDGLMRLLARRELMMIVKSIINFHNLVSSTTNGSLLTG